MICVNTRVEVNWDLTELSIPSGSGLLGSSIHSGSGMVVESATMIIYELIEIIVKLSHVIFWRLKEGILWLLHLTVMSQGFFWIRLSLHLLRNYEWKQWKKRWSLEKVIMSGTWLTYCLVVRPLWTNGFHISYVRRITPLRGIRRD